ncbi:MAG TPA: hypothetical protein VLR27_04520 [Acidimicrobiales bacterium]|nr:hypothetical protein [Acidimicrobiales bacterium]
MPSRRSTARRRMAVVLAVLGLGGALAGCGDDTDEVAATGDERAEQAETAASEAGLEDEVAEFLGLLARGETATYRVEFPGPVEGTELLIANRPPDRRVEVVADGTTTELRLVIEGQAFTCTPSAEEDELTCERTDALVEPPGVFRAEALDELSEALAERSDDYSFEIETLTVAGVEARCLVTRLRSGRESAELGSSGTICASPEGAVLLVDQGSDRLEATDYGTDVADDAFLRPDRPEDDADS